MSNQRLLAKMKCSYMSDFGNNNQQGFLNAVTADTEENKTFSIYTPSAKLEMMVTKPEAMGFYEPGYEYLITVEKLPK